jgi:hypothetical protein
VTIIIHQAICGEQNKAWELIRTTLPDNITAKKIAFQADLQDSPSSGIIWLPAIRGFLVNEYYILIKTYPDNSPDVRNGRVFSHCLIVEKLALSKINDLSELLMNFRDDLDKTIQLQPIEFTPKNDVKLALDDRLQLRFNKAIRALVGFSDNIGVLIWVGQNHFDKAVCKFWQLLSPEQRMNFNFGINFNPSEVLKDKISFIAIPDNVENKFDNKGFIIISPEDSTLLTEFSEQYIAGDQSAIDRLRSFTLSIESKDLSMKDISIIAKGIQTSENIEKITDLKLLVTLSNIISKYSPQEIKGHSIKSKLVDRIAILIETADPDDIFLLRNFELKSFLDSKELFSRSIDSWCNNYLLSEEKNRKFDFVPFIIHLYTLSISNWLISLVREKIAIFLSDINIVKSRIVWFWLKNDVRILKKIAKEIENTTEAENFFSESYKKIDNSILSDVKIFALERGWLKLFATIVKSQSSFELAMTELLEVDTEITHFDAIDLLTKGISSKNVIAFTVINGDKRCIAISGRLCKKEPSLLEQLQLENEIWQEIWLTSITNGNKLSDGIKEPQKNIYKLFDLLIKSHAINESLLEKIGDSEYANVLDYPQRSKIWSKLPTKFKNRFLEKTSSVLLEKLSKNSTFQVPHDIELSNYIISNAISSFLYFNRANIKTCLPIFNTYNQLPEFILKDYVSNYSGNLDVVDATQLGQIVYERGYNSVANTIHHKTYSNKQFKTALAECYTLLDFITRGFAWYSGAISNIDFSIDEWWDAFIELSYKLYSGGPTENKVWSEADGKDYDLLTRGTGKEVWISALQKLRHGGCTGITIKKLIKVMQKDFPNNDELRTLKNLSKKL